jgi:NADH dehydrogenase
VILVTGGTGFVGPKVVHALRARELPVRCLVRNPGNENARRLESWGCELRQGDVTDAASLRRAVEGCDAVVHLVAIIVGKPRDFERVMTHPTRDLVEAASAAGVRRFVLMSALGTSEETKGLVPYFGAKWEMEQTVKAAPVEHVIFRPSFVFGSDGGVLPVFMRLVRLSPVTPVIGPGEQRIQPIWVEDVAEHFAESIAKAEAANRTFELGGPDVVTWNELYERIKRTLGKRRPTVHVPFALMRVQARLLELLPKPPVTRDQLTMLEAGDNVVSNTGAAETFGLPHVPLDEQLRRAAS